MRTAYDLSPLYGSMVGIDRMASLIETATRGDMGGNYPPYDIERRARTPTASPWRRPASGPTTWRSWRNPTCWS